MTNFFIRTANDSDIKGIIDVYKPFVEKTTYTFETTVPTNLKIKQLIENTKLSKLPFLVVKINGTIIAYAFASRFQEKRQAYKYTCIANIYVDAKFHGGEVSHLLYEKLEKQLIESGIVQVYSNITGTNISAQKFLEQHQFIKVGHMPKFGYKFEQWHDIIWMAKTIQ
ncbi:GNAT family N-acetyltransferase [Aerococcaceae bacterium WGS1372]